VEKTSKIIAAALQKAQKSQTCEKNESRENRTILQALCKKHNKTSLELDKK